MFIVHIFEAVTILHSQQLIKQNLLKINSFNIEHSYQAVVVAFIAHHVVAVSLIFIDINVLMNDSLGQAHLQHQIKCNIFESQVTVNKLGEKCGVR